MNLVEMKCKNCGAKLEINNETKEATCRFCGMTFKIFLLEEPLKSVEKELLLNN